MIYLKSKSNKPTEQKNIPDLGLAYSTTSQQVNWHNMEMNEQQGRNGNLLNWLSQIKKKNNLCHNNWLYKMHSTEESDVTFFFFPWQFCPFLVGQG